MSTICGEEKHPYCTITFYVSKSSSAPLTALLLAFPIAIVVSHCRDSILYRLVLA
jgi:phosphatidylinositol glycan class O